MSVTLESLATCFQGLLPAQLFTCSKDGIPNAAMSPIVIDNAPASPTVVVIVPAYVVPYELYVHRRSAVCDSSTSPTRPVTGAEVAGVNAVPLAGTYCAV